MKFTLLSGGKFRVFPTSHPEIRTDELEALTNISLVVKIISEIN
jgi:hypothetical protein